MCLLENAGLSERKARCWLLSEHGGPHAGMLVSGCRDTSPLKCHKGCQAEYSDKSSKSFAYSRVCVCVFSVLDLNAFERQNKAEGLGMAMDESSGIHMEI